MSHHEKLQTGRGVCPVNGSPRWSFRGISHNPHFVISYGSPTHDPIPGWVCTGEANNGGLMFARKDGEHSLHLPPVPSITIPEDLISKASPELIHRVYETLLRFCPLTASHRGHLIRRGLSFKGLRTLLTLGSLPYPRNRPKVALQIRDELEISTDELLGVPGFFINDKNHLSITGATGLLIPAFDAKGRIQALQIRRDKVEKDKSRYIWLSSSSKESGQSSGAPACFLGNRHSSTIWITEGSIKGAALLLHEWTEATIAVAGVGNVQSAIDILNSLENVQEIVIAYDADWKSKEGVLKGLSRLLRETQRLGVKVKAIGWNPAFGKGIDDALTNGLSPNELFEIPIDGVLRAASVVKTSNPNLQTEKLLPIWEPSTDSQPTQDELRQETERVLIDALRKPAGTFSSIAANTGSGKTYSTIRHCLPRTLFVYRNYAALEEVEAQLREIHGPGKVRVFYGRIAPPKDGDYAALKRYERAGCPQYAEMKKRADRGHSPCQGCPFAPKANPEEGEEQNLCPYWEQRLETVNNPTTYLLSVPQSFAYNPSLLQLLPNDDTMSFFREYTQLVIDDCPEFISNLARQRAATLSDVEEWKNHPGLNPSDPAQTELIVWLELLHRSFTSSLSTKEESKLRELSGKIALLDEYVCEEPVDDQWPLRAIYALATWLCRGGEIRFEGEGRQRKITFLQPATELIKRLQYMTVCHLDATPDEPSLEWFANLAGMQFEAPQMQRVFPRIVQVPDVLWDRSQVQKNLPLVQALTEKVQKEQGIVLGFKNREGEEENHLPLDGHWGYSERGLNCYTGVDSIALIGHYALPLPEIQGIAWRMRSLAKLMDAPAPDSFVQDNFTGSRTYTDSWRPWNRTMHVAEDNLVEHLRRHRHTSAVVQGANRPRNLNAPVYLLSGEPLDGLPWDVPVELHTRKELTALLQLEFHETPKPKKILPSTLQTTNEQRAMNAQERMDKHMPSAREYTHQLGRVPGIQKLRSFLGEGEKISSQLLAERVQDQLKLEFADSDTAETLEEKGDEGASGSIELGVPHTAYRSLKEIKAVSGILSSKPGSSLESLEKQTKEPTPCQFLPSKPPTSDEIASIPPMARGRLRNLCTPGVSNGWNDDVIRQIARTYNLNPELLYRYAGVPIPLLE